MSWEVPSYNDTGKAYQLRILPLSDYQLPGPPLTITTTDYVTNNPNIQAICLEIITGLYNEVLNIDPESNTIKFFLRGTNVTPFIKHSYNPEKYKFPYNLTSDFDCEVLINPNLDKDEFEAKHKLVLDQLFKYIIKIVKKEEYWPFVQSTVPLNNNYPILLTNDEYTPLNKLILKEFEEREGKTSKNVVKYNNIPKGSPFYLFKVNKLLDTNISQIKFGIRIPKSHKVFKYTTLDLIDISIPKQANKDITHLWKLIHDTNEKTGEIINVLKNYSEDIPSPVYQKYIHVQFPRLDLASAVLNLEYAANKTREPRPEKRKKRTNTAKNLRNFYKSTILGYKSTSGGNRTKRRARK